MEDKNLTTIEDIAEDYVGELLDLIRSDISDEELKEKIEDYHDNDIAGAIEQLTPDERKRLYRILGIGVAKTILGR